MLGSTKLISMLLAASAFGESPDPGKIAFVSQRAGNASIFVMDADGAVQTRLTTPGRRGEDNVPAWALDACRIAFRRGADLYVMNADGSGDRVIAQSVVADPQFDLRLQFTPDGTHLGAAGRLHSLDGSAVPDLPEDLMWSPDGSRTAYVGEAGLVVLELEGTVASAESARRITEAAGRTVVATAALPDWLSLEQPAWSADGSRLALAADQGGDPLEIQLLVIELADGTIRRLTDGPQMVQRPVWSPAGSKLAFESVVEARGEVDMRLEVMNSDGGGRTVVADRLAVDVWETRFNRASWSPDGSRITFARESSKAGRRPRTVDVYTVNVDGTDLRRLTTDGRSFSPAWSPHARCSAVAADAE